VPAEAATLPLFRTIYADIGDAQSIESNLSSFSSHILNVDRIARLANEDSLVLLDELGSATDPRRARRWLWRLPGTSSACARGAALRHTSPR